MQLIPEFDFDLVFRSVWTSEFTYYGWVMLMGWLVSVSCGLVGHFLVLRRMALVGDAISHSVLPGLVIAFLITHSLEGPVMLIGAAAAGICATLLIEMVHKVSRVKADAALGIVFSTLFAVGVILITLLAGDVHLDVEHVLYGAIEFVPWEAPVSLAGIGVPKPVLQMALVCAGVGLSVLLLYKELLVTCFDPMMARSTGMPVAVLHYGMMAVLAIVVVSAFSAVGAILVIAMLIFPATTAALFSDRMPVLLWSTFPLSLAYAVGGMHLALWLGCSTAGAMVVVAFGLFLLSWLVAPRRGCIARVITRRQSIRDT